MASTSVQVALRVRPLTTNEQLANCEECISCLPDTNEVIIGHDRAFDYDYVFDPDTTQAQLYARCVQPLVDRFLDGYNVTVLAYGQTGSGKTYSMGTGLDASTNDPGVVPRAAADIFTAMNALKAKFPEAEFEVRVAFLELYNEELIDLLSNQRRDPKHAPQIREDGKGGIMWTNVENVVVETPEELLAALRKGSMCRTVGSTDMNLTSSRSHAIFSVTLTQRRPVQLDDMGQAISLKDTLMNENIGKTTENNEVKPKNESENAETPEGEATGAEKPTAPEIEVRTLVSKFHFVDLAGSERLKRTNATGDRAKEGISINAGLLALGNVISALADASSLKPGQPAPHIPYRDSKLTRLLQDSLGGNSQTLMLACVSASDSNFSETLSTLRYASRARKIQNRIRANVDDATASAAEVARLRAQVARLQNQLSELRKANLSSTNEPSPMEIERRKWLEHEVYRARFDASRLKERIQELEQEVIRTRAERDTLIFQYGEAGEEIDMDSDDAVHPLILKYIREIGELEHQLKEANRELRYYKEKDESTELEMESLDGFSLGSQTPSTPSSRATSRADRLSLFEVDLEKVIQDAEENQFSLTDSSSVTGDHMTRTTTQTSMRSEDMFDPEKFTLPPEYEMAPDEDENEYMEKMLRQINDSIVLKEGLLEHIEQLQQAVATKETLLRELEQSRYEQLVMREEYDRRLQELQESLARAQEERDQALKNLPSRQNAKLSNDVKQRYEQKMKALINEIAELRKESNEANRAAETARNQNQFMLRNMKQHLEALKGEKQRMANQMKEEAQRVREQIATYQREIQSLRRQERKATEALQRLEKQFELQRKTLKKEQEEKRMLQTQLKQAQKMLAKAKSPASSPSPRESRMDRRSVSSLQRQSMSDNRRMPKRPNTSTDVIDNSMSGIRATFKRQLLEREIGMCVAKRQVYQVLDELSAKRDRLQAERQALLEERELILREEEEASGVAPDPSTPLYMDDRVELIEAEVSYLDARIRGLRVEAAQMNLWEPGPGWLGHDTSYDNAVQIIQTLPATEARRMLWFFMDEIIRLRVEQWSRQMAVSEMEKSMMDMRRTLLMMRKTAVAAAVEYEKRLRKLEQRLMAKEMGTRASRSKEPKSPTSPSKDVAIFERIYERGIFTKAVRTVEGPISPIIAAERRHMVTKSEGYLLAGQYHASAGGNLHNENKAPSECSSGSSGSSDAFGAPPLADTNIRVGLIRTNSNPDHRANKAATLAALEGNVRRARSSSSCSSVSIQSTTRPRSNLTVITKRRSLIFQEIMPSSPTDSIASLEAQELCREVDMIMEAAARNTPTRPRSMSFHSTSSTVRSRTSLGSHSRSNSGTTASLMSLIMPLRKTHSSANSSTGASGSVVDEAIASTGDSGEPASALHIDTQLHRRDSISSGLSAM